MCMDAYTRGKADAFVGFAQQPVELRAKKIGRVIVNTTTDRPWSQYYCCMLGANRDFVQKLSGDDQACHARDPQSGRHLRE